MNRWSQFVYRRKWWVLLGCIAVLGATLVMLFQGGDLHESNTVKFEANQGFALENSQLPSTGGASFQLVMGSDGLTVGEPAFNAAVESALKPLQSDSRVHTVTVPSLSSSAQSPEISNDRHYIVVFVGLHETNFFKASNIYDQLRREVSSSVLTIHPLGTLVLNSEFNTLAERDLQRAELISLPISLLILIVIFGSVTASVLPLIVGLFTITGGIGLAYGLSHHYDISSYAIDIIGLVGLGVSIDYSLFIVSRFRDELRRDPSVRDALIQTMNTAGRAIVYSGVTVAVGLCGLLFYQGTFLGSLGYTGAIVVLFTIIYATTLLPALLAILGPNVDRWRLFRLKRNRPETRGFWNRLATAVMKHPWWVLVPCLAVLVAAGSPFPGIKLANADITLLPKSDDARQGFDLYSTRFGVGANQIDIVLDFKGGGPFAAQNVASAFDLAQRLKTTGGIDSVQGYVAIPNGPDSAGGYEQLYAQGLQGLPAGARNDVARTLGPNIAVLHAYTAYETTSDQAVNLVKAIRSNDSIPGASVYVTGESAYNVDFVQFMLDKTPYAVIFVMGVTYVILMLLLRSIILPLKAVIMNLLSVSAAFGAMVFIFQDGHFSSFLDFSAAPIDPVLPILLFCIVYGLSMDYEVFLLTRMQEKYREHNDNRDAVAQGLQASGRLVTGAAAIMVSVFAAFGAASVVVIKSIGIGMTIAVLVDATIVRALVVPAVMRLLGRANWWAPRWLRR